MSGRSITVRILELSNRYPVSRGMVSYAVIWPMGSLVQQSFEGKEKYDWARVARYSIFGCFYVAPTLNLWMKIATKLWPTMTLGASVKKALIEQVSYGPFSIVSFYFGMSLLERKSVDEAKQEVKNKFVDTYKVSVCVWPFVQTFNFAFVPEKNRVPFVSFCSLIWTSFLAYMKHRQAKQEIR